VELHHLRRFSILAEELHFTRAAERLHIEQSPLSRTIKELEDDLGVQLFVRDRRGTRMTSAGTVFLRDVRRVFTALEYARENVRAVAAGLRGSLRIAVSDGAIDSRLSIFLARCREEEPEIEMHLYEVPLAEQLCGLRTSDFMIGFAHTSDVGEDIVAEPIWQDPLVVAVSTHHPLLEHTAIPLHALAHYPLILCDPQVCGGSCREVSRLLHLLEHESNVVEYVSSQDMMLTLVGAGYGVGFIMANRFEPSRCPHVLTRPLAVESALITTYLLRLNDEGASELLDRLVKRLYDCANH